MGRLIVFRQSARGEELYDRLSERYKVSLEKWKLALKKTDEIQRRFVDGDLSVQSGPRKGSPLTPGGRRMLMGRLECLIWERNRLLEEQRRLYRIAHNWSEHDREVAGAEEA